MEQEIWKPIPDYEGLYDVSSFGRIRSYSKRLKTNLNSSEQNNIKQLQKHNLGYYKIALYKEGKCKNYFVHRLVYLVFNDLDINSDIVINHLDENKFNNNIFNLEVLNHRENTTYSIDKNKTSSIYTGVFLKKCTKKGKLYSYWCSCITIYNKTIDLGYFKTEKEAHEAYLKALKEYGLENKYATKSQDNS